ncbi:MAG: pyrimidine dimer DNA glycosylase/endonuclease V [Nevskiales bacterium]
MRIWSLHPRYLDPKGLVALWRETLMAQKVLRGDLPAYEKHPQLQRFWSQEAPLACVAAYLRTIHAEASERGYRFDRSKINRKRGQPATIALHAGQLQYEWRYLLDKLARRSPQWYQRYHDFKTPAAHPLFRIVPGDIEHWEKPVELEAS